MLAISSMSDRARKSLKRKNDVRSWSVDMPNITRTARKVEAVINSGAHVIVVKKVKSGARMLIECLADSNKIDSLLSMPIAHVYITKLDRKDIKEQIKEMESYDIKCHQIKNKSDVTDVIESVKDLRESNSVWIHLDESDYGTEKLQLLNEFFDKFRYDKNVKFINYSATNEEAMLSLFGGDEAKVVKLECGPHYKGAKWFLDKGLVKQASPFWNMLANKPTHQGEECINLLLNGYKFFGVVRLTSEYNAVVNNEEFKEYFKELGIHVRFIDQKSSFIWGDNEESDWKKYVYDKRKTLLIVNMTCTRSTEVSFHEHIAFWHDYRKEVASICYNTRSQAYERVNHYDKIGHEIMLYADIPTLQLSAEVIKYDAYPYKLSPRVKGDFIKDRHRVLIEKDLLDSCSFQSLLNKRKISNEYGDRSAIRMFLEKNNRDINPFKKLVHIPKDLEDNMFLQVSGYVATNICASIDDVDTIDRSHSRSRSTNILFHYNKHGKTIKVGFNLDAATSLEEISSYINKADFKPQHEFSKDFDKVERDVVKLHQMYTDDFNQCTDNGKYHYAIMSKHILDIDGTSPAHPDDYEVFLSSSEEYFIIENENQLNSYLFHDELDDSCEKKKLKGKAIQGKYYGTIIDSGRILRQQATNSMYN